MLSRTSFLYTLIFVQSLILENEANNLIQQLLIVPEQPHWALNTKVVIIYIKIYARMQQRLKFNMKLQIQFKNNAVFMSCNIFSMLMVSV